MSRRYLIRANAARRGRFGAKAFCAAAAISAGGLVSEQALAQAATTPSSEEESTERLAKQAQNPIADLISIPFQNNFNFGVGPYNRLQYNLNFQPVIPFHLTDDWNLITRWITPLIDQPQSSPIGGREFGLGNINPSFFFSPRNSGEITWGFGPTITAPTASFADLGSTKWAGGPTFVILDITGPWVFGTLINNQWSFAGPGDNSQNVNTMLIQPFVNYNFEHGWYVKSAPIITANWIGQGDKWTVPVGGGFGRLQKIGKLPVNISLEAYYYVDRPTFTPSWTTRFTVTALLP